MSAGRGGVAFAGQDGTVSPAGPSGLGREIAAGATLGVIALPFCVTAGVLAYEPLGPEHIGAGAAAGILCGVAGGVTGALLRSSSFIPNAPAITMALIQASFVAALLSASGGDRSAALALMPLSVIGAGLTQALIAASGLARVVKFTPYPVLAGFVTGLAVLTFSQQLPRLFGAPSLPALGAALLALELPAPAMPLFGLAIVLLVALSERVAPRFPAMLVALVAGTAAWHLFAALLPELALGRTIGAVSLAQASLGLSLDLPAIASALGDRAVLGPLLLTSVTLGLLGTLDLSFATRAAQNLADIPAAPRRDLAGQGASNIAAALAGGLAVTSSIAYANTLYEAGGRTRLSTVSVALVLLLAAAVAPRLIAALPVVVLAALLLAIALRMWDRWCVGVLRDTVLARDPAARIRARRNAAIVLGVAGATVLGQPVIGALVGIVLSCLVFIMEMSRPIIRRRLDGSQLASKRIRSQADRAALAACAARTVVLDLQGVLFFGNADDLAQEIKRAERGARTIILDLRRVSDLDTSGLTVLRQVAQRCRADGVRLLVAGAGPTYDELLRGTLAPAGAAAFFPDLDAALEAAEDAALRAEAAAPGPSEPLPLARTDLASGLSERELAALAGRLAACRYAAGEALCRAGEPADRLWLITRGSVSVRVAGAHGARRIAGLGSGTSVGEMGLLDRRPRSADVVADEDVDALVLTGDGFDDLLRTEPRLGQSLLATIARLTAQRLRATSDELRLAEA